MKINYVKGDLFVAVRKLTGTVLIPHVCNDRGGWGAGFVVPLGRAYPAAERAYWAWAQVLVPPDVVMYGQTDAFALGSVQFVRIPGTPDVVICNMVAQTLGGERPLRYNALARCMDQVAEYSDTPKIHAPMFGAGLAGGDWAVIEQLVYDCWLRDAHIPVTIYRL